MSTDYKAHNMQYIVLMYFTIYTLHSVFRKCILKLSNSMTVVNVFSQIRQKKERFPSKNKLHVWLVNLKPLNILLTIFWIFPHYTLICWYPVIHGDNEKISHWSYIAITSSCDVRYFIHRNQSKDKRSISFPHGRGRIFFFI